MRGGLLPAPKNLHPLNRLIAMLALIVIAVAGLTISVLLTAIWIGNRIRTVPSDHMRRAQRPDGSVAIDRRAPPNISEPTPVALETRHPDERSKARHAAAAFAEHQRPGREPELELTAFDRERRVAAVVEAKRGRPALPIRPLFAGSFDPEDTHAMGVAFEQACQSLGIADKAAPMAKALAITIIDAGMTGERDAVRLYQAAMRWAPNAA